MLKTVTKNSTVIMMKYTWYHRYREIIWITGGTPLRLHRSQIRRWEGENSNALTSYEHSLEWCRLELLLSINISAIRDVVLYISHLNQLKYSSNVAHNGNKAIPLAQRVHRDTSQCSWFSLRFLQHNRNHS